MAMRRIRRRRLGARGVSVWFRGKAIGLLFIALVPVLLAIMGLLLSVTPSFYVYVDNGSLGAGSTLPAGATGVDAKTIVALIAFIFVVMLFVSAIRKVSGVRI